MQTVVPANKENSAIRTKSELTMQLRGHTADKLYYYGQCDKAFSSNGYLTVHLKIHTGENLISAANVTKHLIVQ